MYLEEIVLLLENRLSPRTFEFKNDFYGIQYGKGENKVIKKILLTLDLTIDSIHFAVKNKINLIITLQGLLNNPIMRFNQYHINKLTLLTRQPIIIFALNTSFIAAEGGISDTIMEALYLKFINVFNINTDNGESVPIGRICQFKPYPHEKQPFRLEDIIKRIKTNFELSRLPYVGNLKKEIDKICVIGGEISSPKYLEELQQCDCDCLILGKINHLDAISSRDNGLSLIEISHYKSAIMAMKRLFNLLSLEFPRDNFFFFPSKNPIQVFM